LEEGFPHLSSRCLYLTDRIPLKIDYSATTERKTVVNLTKPLLFHLAAREMATSSASPVAARGKVTPVDAD